VSTLEAPLVHPAVRARVGAPTTRPAADISSRLAGAGPLGFAGFVVGLAFLVTTGPRLVRSERS
jgi:hypothetical protein